MSLERCDRCGGKPPFKTHFWATRMGALCDECNAEWACFRDFWYYPLLEWAGLIQVKVHRERRIRALATKEME